MVFTGNMLVALIAAVGLQIGLLSLALLIELSERKRRPRSYLRPPKPAGAAAKTRADQVHGRGRKTAPVRPTGAHHGTLHELERPEPKPPTLAAEVPAHAPPSEASEAAAAAEPIPSRQPERSGAFEDKAQLRRAEEPEKPADRVTERAVAQDERAGTELALPSRKPRLGLLRTRQGFLQRLRSAITGRARLDEIYEGLEEALIGADVGVEASLHLVEAVRSRLGGEARPDTIREALKAEMGNMLTAVARPIAEPAAGAPLVIMLSGVNGVGKTTTIAKLAARFKAERGPVVVAAADTFRAAAIEQMEVWCQRAGAEIVKQKQGSDPAAVAFDALKAATARHARVLLIDTAGRLQTKVNLMEELKKIARVVGRELPGAPHENWLVLDATTGQNALSQARLFNEAVTLSGVILAKLDSTAKGGMVLAIARQLNLPVRFVGVGEALEDLEPFDPGDFVEELFQDDETPVSPRGSYAA